MNAFAGSNPVRLSCLINGFYAVVEELVVSPDLKSGSRNGSGGSSPPDRTKKVER